MFNRLYYRLYKVSLWKPMEIELLHTLGLKWCSFMRTSGVRVHCMYACECLCTCIFELAYLMNYDYWSNIVVPSLFAVQYRSFSRDLLYTSHVSRSGYYIFFFSVFFTLLFIFYLLGTPRAKRYNRLYVSSTRYAALNFMFWIVRWPWYVFVFTVLLGKASICLKKVRRLRWDWATRANTRIRMTLKRTRFNESSKSSIEKRACDNLTKERDGFL